MKRRQQQKEEISSIMPPHIRGEGSKASEGRKAVTGLMRLGRVGLAGVLGASLFLGVWTVPAMAEDTAAQRGTPAQQATDKKETG